MAQPDTQFFADNAGVIEQQVFEQILDMDDDDDDKDFSKSIVFGFLDQAENTFKKMDEAKKSKDLPELSRLGHFLKGSSATMGFSKVRDECTKIQHYGAKKDATGEIDEPDEDKCLSLIAECISKAESAYDEVKALMFQLYPRP